MLPSSFGFLSSSLYFMTFQKRKTKSDAYKNLLCGEDSIKRGYAKVFFAPIVPYKK